MNKILGGGGTKTAPSKPITKPGKKEKPGNPYQPGVGPKHNPKA
jgi:hypothetical protein